MGVIEHIVVWQNSGVAGPRASLIYEHSLFQQYSKPSGGPTETAGITPKKQMGWDC